METGSDSRDSKDGDDQKAEEDSSGSLYYERVISVKQRLDQDQDSKKLAKQALDSGQAESSISACSDEIQSHIVAEAGEDISL